MKGDNFLLQTIKHLRDPKKGCPWDLKQDNFSLIPYFYEELSEFEESLLNNGIESPETVNELGDLLFQIVFHAQILEEKRITNINEIAEKCAEKLIHRHPHVFLNEVETITNAETVRQNWEKQKHKEREKTASKHPIAEHVAKVPPQLGSLIKAQRLGDRAASFGFDWKTAEEAMNKVQEEYQEFISEENEEEEQEELGDLLFTLCQYARKKEWNIDLILKKSSLKFLERFRLMEEFLAQKGLSTDHLGPEEWDLAWNEAKNRLNCKPLNKKDS